MAKLTIYQGSTYKIPFRLSIKGAPITNSDVATVEFAFGDLIKTYPKDATYEDGMFIVSLTQEETFKLQGNVPFQTRVKFNDGSVKPSKQQSLSISNSVSREVL